MGKTRARNANLTNSSPGNPTQDPAIPHQTTTTSWLHTCFALSRIGQGVRTILLLLWTVGLVAVSASAIWPAGRLQITVLKTCWSVTASLSYTILLEEIILLSTNYFIAWYPGHGLPLWAILTAVAMRAKVGASVFLTALVPILCKMMPSAISALFTAFLVVSSRPQVWRNVSGMLGGVCLCNGEDCWVMPGTLYIRAVQGFIGHAEPLKLDHCNQKQVCIMPRWPTRHHTTAGFVPVYHTFLNQPAVRIQYEGSSGDGYRDPGNCTLIHTSAGGGSGHALYMCTDFQDNSTVHVRHTVNLMHEDGGGWYHCDILLTGISANYTVLTTQEYPIVMHAVESGPPILNVWKSFAAQEVGKLALTLTDTMFWQADTKVSPQRFRSDPQLADGYCHALALVSVQRDAADGQALKTLTKVPKQLHQAANEGALISSDSVCCALLIGLVLLCVVCHLPGLVWSYPVELSVVQLSAMLDRVQPLLRDGSAPDYAASRSQARVLWRSLRTAVRLQVEDREVLDTSRDMHLTTEDDVMPTRHFRQYAALTHRGARRNGRAVNAVGASNSSSVDHSIVVELGSTVPPNQRERGAPEKRADDGVADEQDWKALLT